MILDPYLVHATINRILLVFGSIGLLFSLKNLQLYRHPKQLKAKWLKMHLGNMICAYISAVTAFVVVNQFFPSFYGWFISGIIGGAYITYWIKK